MNPWEKRTGLCWEEPLIFERGNTGHHGYDLPRSDVDELDPASVIDASLLRETPAGLPQVSEPEVVRHFSRLSTWNYSVDHGFYPLGSCTMKYNPKVNEVLSNAPGWRDIHPAQPADQVPGALKLMHELACYLEEISGMHHVSLQPAAGAQGELTGMLMVRAYHHDQGRDRDTVLIPDTAHGTNPASSALAGYQVVEIPTGEDGILHPEAVAEHMNENVAALMLTNPNTLGLFESHIAKIAKIVHDKGGLVYCDGANMNAIMGISRPGDMGVDVIQFNLHKTFSTPHGGGGPGSGPVGISKVLEPYLPVPVIEESQGKAMMNWDRPKSIGKVTAYIGQFLIMVRAYAYIRRLGAEGLLQASQTALLNANYLRVLLKEHFHVPHPDACMHECVLSDKSLPKGVSTLDVAKRLIDYGFHPPTIYFPLVVHGAMMIEPTETESKAELEAFAEAMKLISREAREEPEKLTHAPCTTPVSRLDEVTAARKPKLRWTQKD